MEDIKKNLDVIRGEIRETAESCGRSADDVLLVAVSKTRTPEEINVAIDAGVTDIGENKVQEIMDKFDAVKPVKWHMIGHLQRNKVKYIVDKVAMIHSVDSMRLAETIEQEAARRDIRVPVLIEVNVAEEESKFGLKLHKVIPFLEQASMLPHLDIRGLMTIAPFVDDPEDNREIFRQLKKLSVDIAAKNINNITMSVLSMGMTGDYEVAVQEGATMVRVGTGIFGERNYAIGR